MTPKAPVYRVSSETTKFSHFGQPYWIRHFEFSEFWVRFVTSDLKSLRVPSFIRIDQLFEFWSAILDPPFYISDFWVQIRNQRFRTSANTEFHPKRPTFCISVNHTGSAILNFGILSCDSYSSIPNTPRAPSFIRIDQLFEF